MMVRFFIQINIGAMLLIIDKTALRTDNMDKGPN
jgi:hypothetical protein